LVEAALISDSRTALATAQSFLVQLEEQSELLTPKKLSALCRLPVAVRAHGQKRAAKRPSIRLGGSNAWFCRVRDLVDAGSAAEAKAVERAEGIVERRLGVEEPSYLRWVGRSTLRARARGGDLMVVASSRRRGQTPYAVSPPLAILYRQDKDHWTRFYYAEELGRPMRDVTWVQLKRLAKAVGLSVSRSRPIAGRELSDLLRIWPRDSDGKS